MRPLDSLRRLTERGRQGKLMAVSEPGAGTGWWRRHSYWERLAVKGTEGAQDTAARGILITPAHGPGSPVHMLAYFTQDTIH